MKNYLILFGIVATTFFVACNKNDDSVSPEIELQNEPPLAFDLIGVTDGAADVDVLPAFSWEASIDPNGDAVNYTFSLGETINSIKPYATDIAATQFAITERLNLKSDYYWKVTAEDNKSGITESAINQFTTRGLNLPEDPILWHAPFSKRSGHTSVVFQNKIWVIGGYDGESYKNDIWYSEDGETWTASTTNAGFAPRSGHTSVVFDDKLWVIAGRLGANRYNDVWYTSDGSTWIEATESADFPSTTAHTSLVFDNKIWVIGGGLEGENLTVSNYAWYSTDGVEWTKAPELPFKRYAHTSVVFDNKMWVIAGNDEVTSGGTTARGDVWHSEDGMTWTKTSSSNSYRLRSLHASTVFDNKIYNVGGFFHGCQNDIYCTSAEINWQRVEGEKAFHGRAGHSIVVFDNKLWIIGGDTRINNSHQYLNDVWALD
ncbi:Kelch repeat-containing protein [Maribacter halichondriae]|uniref:Kelch repeat-containing protein n=1 Tax=Maribacter halichondriae TaxID=2980554 RepID=UPI00235A2497|nr:kelch repeat-containing protein [Maribacter sp. Hal144]